jgi:hypothetical protein
MGTIINLIIIFIVVASVIKRFQELSKSGETIQKPRPETEPGKKPIMETENSEYDEEKSFEEEYSPPVIPEPVKTQKPLLDRHSRTLDEIFEQMKTPEPKKEMVFASSNEIVSDKSGDNIYNAPRSITTDSRQDGAYLKGNAARIHYPGNSTKSVLPEFGCNEVVKGLVMSEILGRPVSMKRPNEWW